MELQLNYQQFSLITAKSYRYGWENRTIIGSNYDHNLFVAKSIRNQKNMSFVSKLKVFWTQNFKFSPYKSSNSQNS